MKPHSWMGDRVVGWGARDLLILWIWMEFKLLEFKMRCVPSAQYPTWNDVSAIATQDQGLYKHVVHDTSLTVHFVAHWQF